MGKVTQATVSSKPPLFQIKSPYPMMALFSVWHLLFRCLIDGTAGTPKVLRHTHIHMHSDM